MLEAVVKRAERISEGGNLLANLKLLDSIDTWETSQEVFKAWRDVASIEGVSTANMGIYRLEGDDVVFDLFLRNVSSRAAVITSRPESIKALSKMLLVSQVFQFWKNSP